MKNEERMGAMERKLKALERAVAFLERRQQEMAKQKETK